MTDITFKRLSGLNCVDQSCSGRSLVEVDNLSLGSWIQLLVTIYFLLIWKSMKEAWLFSLQKVHYNL